MDQYSFLPVQVKEDVMIVYEPFATKIMNSLSGNMTLKQKDYVSLSLEKVEKKEQFIDKIKQKVKELQDSMIKDFLNKKPLHYL